MKQIFLLAGVLCSMACNAQLPSQGGFPTTDSLRSYNNRWVGNSAVESFAQKRLNTLIHGLIQHIDSAKLGPGGTLGIDTLYQINDSTIRYRKNGVNRAFTIKGVYDRRRKVDSAFSFNDSTLRIVINGAPRDIVIRGNATGSVEYADNLGAGASVYKTKDGQIFTFRTLWSSDTSLLVTQLDSSISINLNPAKVISLQRLADSIAVVRGIIDAVTFTRTPGKDSIFLTINGRRLAVKDSTGGGGISVINTTNSIAKGTGDSIKLVNDAQTPGINKVYGTDGTGTRGWKNDPSGGSGTQDAIQITLSQLDVGIGLDTTKVYLVTDPFMQGRFYYSGLVANQSTDNGATVIVSTDLRQWKRIYAAYLDIRWFGAREGNIMYSNGNRIAYYKMRSAATDNEQMFIDKGKWYFDSTLALNSTSTLHHNLYTIGELYFPNGTDGITLGQEWPASFVNESRIVGAGATNVTRDSMYYDALTGRGVALMNSHHCYVKVNYVEFFKVGIEIAGHNYVSSNPAVNGRQYGAQYNDVFFNHLRFNQHQVRFMTYQKPSNTTGNWVNENRLWGGQLGGGTNYGNGGWWGMTSGWDEASGGVPVGGFEGNKMYNFGFEGLEYASDFKLLTASKFISPTIEQGVKYFHKLRAPYCVNNEFVACRVFSTHWLMHPNMGSGTHVTGSIWVVDTTDTDNQGPIGFDAYVESIDGRQRFVVKSSRQTTGTVWANPWTYYVDMLTDDARYRTVQSGARRFDGVTRNTPYKGTYLNVTNQSADTINMPYNCSYVRYAHASDKVIRIRGEDLLGVDPEGFKVEFVGPGKPTFVRGDNNTVVLYPSAFSVVGMRWQADFRSGGYVFYRDDFPSGSVGTGDMVSTVTSSTDGQLFVANGITAKSFKPFTATGPLKSASGVIGAGAINLATEVTGLLPITALSGSGAVSGNVPTWNGSAWTLATPSGGGGSSIFTAGSGTGSPYYRNAGSVNIGVNPSQSYAWTHWGASTATLGLWEFSAASVKPTTMRAHSMAYQASASTLWLADAAGIPWKVLTEGTDGAFRGSYEGYDIHPEFIDPVGSIKNDVLVSNGTDGYAPQRPRYELLYSQTATVNVTNTTTATSIFTGGAKTYTDYNFVAGDVMVIESNGIVYRQDGTSNSKLDWVLTINGYTFTSTGLNNPTYSIGGNAMQHRIIVTFTGTGTNTTANITWYIKIGDDPYLNLPLTAASGINTVSPSINIAGKWNTANAANQIRPFNTTIESKRRPAP